VITLYSPTLARTIACKYMAISHIRDWERQYSLQRHNGTGIPEDFYVDQFMPFVS
jgi:hypothetical protein